MIVISPSNEDLKKTAFARQLMRCSGRQHTRMVRERLALFYLDHSMTAHRGYGVSRGSVGSPSFKILMRRDSPPCLAAPSNILKRITKYGLQRLRHYSPNWHASNSIRQCQWAMTWTMMSRVWQKRFRLPQVLTCL